MSGENPLRAWLDQRPKPMTHKAFAKRIGISYSFLQTLLRANPPQPAREVMRAITRLTKGAVTANMWVHLPPPPPRRIVDVSLWFSDADREAVREVCSKVEVFQ